MQPQETQRSLGLEPPADRLVVFITDGLRAESFFQNNTSYLPSIQMILKNEGLAGISRTSVSTQTRTGLIAIFGGFNEDPATAALTTFHKSSDIYDTIFNRTAATWGWGGRKVMKMFSNILPNDEDVSFECFNPDEDILGVYDNWAAEQVQRFLNSADNVNTVKNKTPALFLIHFGGLDGVGHKVRPNSDDYLRIVNNTQTKIGQIYKMFERKFPDKRTTYLLTSDHGMPESGSHSGGRNHVIELPFMLWGAGVKRRAPTAEKTYKISSDSVELPLHDLHQNQLAPLMSAFIGLPPPMNNMAEMPLGFMNVSAEYEAYSLYLNAKQMLAQIEQEQKMYPRGILTQMIRKYRSLNMKAIEKYYSQFQQEVQIGCVHEAVQNSRHMIKLALQSLDYYRKYYRAPLSIACLVTYIGWFYYLLAKQRRPCHVPLLEWNSIPVFILFAFEVALGIFLYMEKISFWTSFFLLVPLVVWTVAMREAGATSCCFVKSPGLQLFWIVGSAGLLIATTYYKELISMGYVVIVCVNNWRAFTNPTIKVCLWTLVVAMLAGFTLLQPLEESENKFLLYLSMVLTLLRPLVLNEVHEWRVWLCNSGVLAIGAYCVHCLDMEKAICPFLHGIIWGYVIYALVSIPYSNTKKPLDRVQLIMFNLSTIYTLLSLSYESIFMQIVCSEFMLGLYVRCEYKKFEESQENNNGDAQQREGQMVQADKTEKPMTTEQYIESSYRFALLILIYTYFSNTGVGNLTDITSLEPDVTRLFTSTPSSLLVGCLIMLKFFIPHLIIVSTMYACCARARQNTVGIYIALVLVCDAIALYFFVFVQKNGSWISVRASLSNLLVGHGLPIMFVIFSWVPKQFLSAIPMTMLPMLRWKSEMCLVQPGESLA